MSDQSDPILPIVQTGDPVLRQVARHLTPEEIATPGFRDLVDKMRETMRAAPGVGLAAPQIGLPLALAVIEDTVADPEREREVVPFHVIVNPVLTVEEPGPVVYFEGCLSVVGFAARVPRALAVRVDALDENGKPITIRARGWYARILQHEIDHLNGMLYIDRMDTRTFSRV
jgi:peptide deformylase